MSDIYLEKPSVEYLDHMGDDCSVVNAARVSFSKEVKTLSNDDERLIRYLAKHKHWTPFAHTSVSLRVSNPIFLARQLVKHQVGGVWNEESRRYISSAVSYYLPEDWRRAPMGSIKQGSGEKFDYDRASNIKTSVLALYIKSNELYKDLINQGVCPEQARMVLPLGAMTHWVWTGSLLFWARVYNLRADSHAQRDLEPFVKQLDSIMSNRFPISWKYLKEVQKEEAS